MIQGRCVSGFRAEPSWPSLTSRPARPWTMHRPSRIGIEGRRSPTMPLGDAGRQILDAVLPHRRRANRSYGRSCMRISHGAVGMGVFRCRIRNASARHRRAQPVARVGTCQQPSMAGARRRSRRPGGARRRSDDRLASQLVLCPRGVGPHAAGARPGVAEERESTARARRGATRRSAVTATAPTRGATGGTLSVPSTASSAGPHASGPARSEAIRVPRSRRRTRLRAAAGTTRDRSPAAAAERWTMTRVPARAARPRPTTSLAATRERTSATTRTRRGPAAARAGLRPRSPPCDPAR